MQSNPLDRRDFLKLSAAGATAVAAAVPRAAEGTAPVRIGAIGCGGMGTGHLHTLTRMKDAGEPVDVTAVCDVYRLRAENGAKLTGGKAYGKHEDLLADPNVDAVLVATPDHWHARIACEAMDAGKDVYCEKPMTYWGNLAQAKQIVKTVKRTGRALQVGTQHMADDVWDLAAERIRAGALGGLLQAQAGDLRNGPIGCYTPLSSDGRAEPGVNLDWDRWLGPAPKRPWEPGRFFAFRSFWDYSGGVGTDFFPHVLTPLVHAMDLGFPYRATASGGLYHWDDGREIPDIFTMLIEYPTGPSIMLVGSVSNGTPIPTMIRGTKATLHFQGAGAVLEPEKTTNPDGKREELARTQGSSQQFLWQDFLRCVRTREQPRSHAQLGYHVMAALSMGIASFRTGQTMEFDPRREVARPVRV